VEHLIYRHELQEECGVFGVHAAGEDAARVAFFGIFSLQHRGRRAPASPSPKVSRSISTSRWAL